MSKKKKEIKEEQAQDQKPQKEKKVKVVYYDDGSTVVDMSGTRKSSPKLKSTGREKFETFITVLKKMIIPCLATLFAFTLIYIILSAIAGNL